jgi:hypothetical protein
MPTKRRPQPHATPGRKTKYRPEFCEKLITHMKQGYTFKSFGAVVEPPCSENTLFEWTKRYPAFQESKKIAEAQVEKYYIDTSRLMAMGQVRAVLEERPVLDSKGRPVMDPSTGRPMVTKIYETAKVNPSVHIFLMKNILKWRDEKTHKHGGDDSAPPIRTVSLTDEERVAEIERLAGIREQCGDD